MTRRISSSKTPLNRRQLLRGAGVALALPLLEAMTPISAGLAGGLSATSKPPKRMFAICNNLGFLPDKFFPEGVGKDYLLSPYLEELKEFRNDFTVFSGVSHPDVDGSHSSDVSFLTAAPHPGSGGFRNSISLDQYVATHVGSQTRVPSLTLGVNARRGQRSLSWTEGGALIPCTDSASTVYRQLFLQGSQQEVDAQVRKLRLGRSIMDSLAEQSQSLYRKLGVSDRVRMDQFTTAVRDVERHMAESEQWQYRDKPVPSAKMPIDPPEKSDYIQKTRLMYQMARLAFETDSTRAVTLLLDSNSSPAITVEGIDITDGYHNLSHHGKSEEKLKQLEAIDRAHMRLLNELLGDLKASSEGDTNMLDNAMVFFGSNFGDANSHITNNMPVLLAGGGFRHGQHLAFDKTKNYPLPNVFLSMLQKMSIETDQFASSTGTVSGLDS